MRTSTAKRPCRRPLTVACVVLLAGAGLTACQGQSSGPDDPTPVSADTTPSVPAGLERYYSQEVRWYPCAEDSGMDESSGSGTDYTCARVTVPLDYDAPDGETIELAVKKRSATDDSIGALFVNPGGPGGSGVNLAESATTVFSESLTDSYDVIGFDPRGVGYSSAVDCLTDAELDEERSGTVGEREESTPEAAVASGKEAAAACEGSTKVAGLLDHVDTVSAARDLDVLRAVNDQDALTYLGYSYGTYLGATYADLFPANVGRMVLDGAVDPSLSAAEITQGQAEGFERALRAYVEDCQSGSSCPLTGGVDDGVKQIQDFLASTVTTPVPTSDPGRPLTYSLATSAVLGVLYQSEAWSTLSSGLDQAMSGKDGSVLLTVADLFAQRSSDGTYEGNGDEAINAINCLDYPVEGDEATWSSQAEELRKASPTFGEELAYSDAYCQGWGHSSRQERSEIRASGAAPILVIGTTGDPATPYDWSVALADQLDSGQLLTWEGEGHTAYGRSGDCVSDAVDTYLLTGRMPQENLTCSG